MFLRALFFGLGLFLIIACTICLIRIPPGQDWNYLKETLWYSSIIVTSGAGLFALITDK